MFKEMHLGAEDINWIWPKNEAQKKNLPKNFKLLHNNAELPKGKLPQSRVGDKFILYDIYLDRVDWNHKKYIQK